MFRDRLHGPDGDDLGEATYALISSRARRSSPETTSGSASSRSFRSRTGMSLRSSTCCRSRRHRKRPARRAEAFALAQSGSGKSARLASRLGTPGSLCKRTLALVASVCYERR